MEKTVEKTKLKKILDYIKKGIFWKKLHRYLFVSRKFYKLFTPLSFFIKVKPNKIVITSFFGRGYGDNGKYITDYILKNKFDYELVWLIDRDICPDNKNFPAEIRLVNLYSWKAMKELASAGIWIDNCRKQVFPKKKKNQKYINTWHGDFVFKKAEGDAQSLPESYIIMAKKDSQNIDLFLSDSKLLTDVIKNCFWYSGEILQCGTPRSDLFFDKNKITVSSSKVREKYKILPDEKIILYAPTFRKDNSLEAYNLDFLLVQKAFEKKYKCPVRICVRLHPNVSLKSSELKIPENVIDASLYDDMQELLCSADAVICDYSSLMFSYWYLNRPIFQFCTDLADYMKNDRDFYFKLEDLPFILAQTNEELYDAIISFDEKKYVEKLLAFKNQYEIYSNGTATKQLVEWIENGI